MLVNSGLLRRKLALWSSASTIEARGLRVLGQRKGVWASSSAAAAGDGTASDRVPTTLQLLSSRQRQQQRTRSRWLSSLSVGGDTIDHRWNRSSRSRSSSRRAEPTGDSRWFGTSSITPTGEKEDEQENKHPEETMATARRRKERRDSVTDSIVKDRERHLARLAGVEANRAMTKKFKALSLGTRKRPRQAGGFNKAYDRSGKQVHSDFAAGGFSRWMGSASKGWPQFKHRLPEVALAGHTNCGKSTLVNALSGIHPRRGPASTSDRAGWTDLVGFYQVGKDPPVLTLVDLPGYGHAVATRQAIKGWLRMIKEYITTREELIRCCVLVDCARGFCEEDRSLLQLLAKRNIPHQIVLTKADLLTPELLSSCVHLMRRDLSDLIGHEKSSLVAFSAVCGSSGSGVTALWKDLEKLASKAPGSLVAMQGAHLAARKDREKQEALVMAKKAERRDREH